MNSLGESMQPAGSGPSRPRSRPHFGWDALHVYSLTSLVIAQNFYDRLAHQAEFLVDPSVTPSAIAWVVVALSVVVPSLIVGLEACAGVFSRTRRESLHLVIVLFFSMMIVAQILHRVMFLPGWSTLVIAPALGCLLTWGYDRFASLRSIVTLASPGIALFPAILWMRLTADDASVAHRAIRDVTRAPVPIVMVVFDEFCGGILQTPERDIDASRFPHFAALQQRATWYRSAACVSPTTVRALPSILTGKYTTTQSAQSLKDVPQNLFSLLSAAAKYDVVAFEPISALAPHNNSLRPAGVIDHWKQAGAILNALGRVYLYEIFHPDFHAHLPRIPPVWFGFHDSTLVDQSALRGTIRYGWTHRRDEQLDHFLRCLDRTPQSMLYFGHFLIPHAPWCYFPTGTRYAEDRDSQDRLCLEAEGVVMTDELGVIQNQQRHLMQVMYLDQQLGLLTERLKKLDLWDRCLLVVTADHGVSFRLGEDRREFSHGNSADILSIPLFIKYPGQSVGETSDLPVQSTDLLPTIMDVVGIQPVAPTDGLSVQDQRLTQRQELVVHDPLNHFTFPPEIIRQSSVPALVRKRFGEGTDRWNLFRIGPQSEWLGLPAESLPHGTSAPLTLECLLPAASLVTGKRNMLPYYIEGRVMASRELEEPVELVAVVDGTICGTTRTYRQFGFQNRWSVMLPEWSFSPGVTVPEFLSVNQDGSLTPCRMQWVESFGEISETDKQP